MKNKDFIVSTTMLYAKIITTLDDINKRREGWIENDFKFLLSINIDEVFATELIKKMSVINKDYNLYSKEYEVLTKLLDQVNDSDIEKEYTKLSKTEYYCLFLNDYSS